ncbi:MAG: hypothetical protein MUF15_13445 [Acidobacteria bacterium]|jgi:hypothetical protein|nr:hypothetical protein [Acidobacteriota bacterium]
MNKYFAIWAICLASVPQHPPKTLTQIPYAKQPSYSFWERASSGEYAFPLHAIKPPIKIDVE